MTDIAPLGFAIDTSGLEKGKQAADAFVRSVGGVSAVTDKATAATIAAAKAERTAAEQAARTATAKLNLLRTTEGVTQATLKEAKATADSANAAAIAARAKYDLAKAGENVEQSMEGIGSRGSMVAGVLQGVAREASALATQMGIGSGAAGRLGVAGAMGAAQGAAGRLAPSLNMLGGITGKLGVGVGALVVGYGALAASLADNQDRWASYQQQLVNSLGSQSAAQDSLYQVVDLANQVGISVDTALQSFNRFARAKDSIGATNAELVQMTEIILKIGRSSGVEAGAMQGAMMQLSQALASGRLNGDELRSIMENMQPLAKAIADGLGVSVGQLRRMGAEGELTSDKIFKALLGQADVAEKAFASMPTTVEQAKTRMANQFDELGAHLGDLINASGVLQAGLNALAAPVEGLNELFRATAKDGMAEVESNLQKLESRIAKLKQQTAPAAAEFDKQFNKELVKSDDLEKQRKEAIERLNKQQEVLVGFETLMQARLAQTRASREEILRLIALSNRGVAFREGANQKRMDLGAGALDEAVKGVEEYRKAIERSKSGIAELDRQLDALKRSDPFEKLTADAEDLEEAFRSGGVTMADTWLQALTISRQTGKSIGEVIAAIQRLEAAQRQLGDAKEIKALNDELAKTAALTAAIGGGSYAERLAGHQADINAFRSDRAMMGGVSAGSVGATGSGPVSPEAFINAIRHIESRGRDYDASGRPLRSSAGALFSMQVMPSTAARPGYGIAPARSQSAAEYNRVGEELARALLQKYGDPLTAGAAYHSGPGNLGRLGPAGRDYQRQIAALLGVSGGAGVATAGTGTGLTEDVIGARSGLFNAQERQRALSMVDQFNSRGTDAVSMARATAQGPEAVRALELELKVLDTIGDVAPEYRQMVEDAIRDADAKERLVDAERKIYDLRRANDQSERRNAALRTGDPRAMRQLELELRIEEIKRTAPASRQGAMIAEARRESELELESALAKRTGDLENQRRAMADQYKMIGLMGDEARIQNRLLQERNFLFQMGADLNSQQVQDYLAQTEALERQLIALDKQLEKWEAIRSTGMETAAEIGRAFATAFGQMTRTGDVKWKDLMGSIEEAFYSALDRMVQQFVISPLVNFLGNLMTSGLNSLFGGGGLNLATNNGSTAPISFTANGGIFSDRGPEPFAWGGILNTPTRFGHGGGQGLAGEGPGLYEGLFPLKRGPDGRLGVAAYGGGGGERSEVNIYDMRAAGTSEAVEVQERETGDGRRKIDILVRDSVKGHMRRGAFDSDQRALYALPRAVARR